ncbi:hypothetical protein SAMN04488072_102312 [Lentibacillus halodurans]|uniref:Uncharacterized protein n=1 Tax=Lentibacillus halodurans TaxID=237679 RepID=A0A1I0W921_9BACI|nr:hypothetical protein [Lentibacillus halodurans]SFA85101.1 hypothetical protein SAMN04488072_102312 [Lentibacillus halodurans]
MQSNNVSIKLIRNKVIVSENNLLNHVYKAAGFKARLNRTVNEKYLQQHAKVCKLIYHPFWLAKTLVIADRPPFSPREQPNMIFVDAVSGYRGVFSRIPPITDQQVNHDDLIPMRISNQDDAVRYIKYVQTRQINRSYVLKKPRHEINELFLVYLPLWKVVIRSGLVNETFYINGNTGESEKFMADRWDGGKDLL